MNKSLPLVLLLFFIILVGCSNDDSIPSILSESGIAPVESVDIPLDSEADIINKGKKKKDERKFKLKKKNSKTYLKYKKFKFFVDSEVVDYMITKNGFVIQALDNSFEIRTKIKKIKKKKRIRRRLRVNTNHLMVFNIKVSKNKYMLITVDFFYGRTRCLKDVLNILGNII